MANVTNSKIQGEVRYLQVYHDLKKLEMFVTTFYPNGIVRKILFASSEKLSINSTINTGCNIP